MYYKIGTLAKRFRISPQTIRYYEKLGFLKADRRDQSTTRYYHARNLKWLCSIRQYHGMGFGSEEICDLFKAETLAELSGKINRKQMKLMEEIRRLEQKLQTLEQKRADIQTCGALLGVCRLETSPCFRMIFDQEDHQVWENPELEEQLESWISFLPQIYSAVLVSREAILADDAHRGRRSGFCVEENRAQALGLSDGSRAERFASRLCIHTVISMAPGEESIAHALRFAKENGLEIVGDALECCLAKVGEIECLQTDVIPGKIYYECYIPVRKKA